MTKDPYFEIRTMFLQAPKGRVFRVAFFKADGTPREIICDPDMAEANVKGSDPGRTDKRRVNNPHLFPVWSVVDKDYRSVNLNTLYEVHIGGKTYDINGLHAVERLAL